MDMDENAGIARRAVRRYQPATSANNSTVRCITLEDDAVAIEEPLEIRVDGQTLAITMRTPGDDVELALGFLFSEGVIASAQDVAAVTDSHGRSVFEGENIVEITLRPGAAAAEWQTLRRGTLTTSACGVCGRKSIGDLRARCQPLPSGPVIDAAVVERCVTRLRQAQENFTRTGGLHAAAAFTATGELLACYEDVGRHNAVDRVVGALLRRGLMSPRLGPGHDPSTAEQRPALMIVSGRASFELVQKTIVARVPILASVSAASSLAIDLAEASGLTLLSFARGGGFNLHGPSDRIRELAAD